MPLSELLYRTAKAKIESSSQDKNPTNSNDVSFVPETDFAELVWENGQIQPSRGRKIQSCVNIPPQAPKHRDKDAITGSNSRTVKFGLTELVMSDIPMPVPSEDVGLNQHDDMVPWLNYPVDDSLRQDGYYSEFSSGLSGVTVLEHCNHSNFATLFDKRSTSNQVPGDSHSTGIHNAFMLGQGSLANLARRGSGEGAIPRTTNSRLYPSPVLQHQTSFPDYGSRVANNDVSTSNAVSKPISRESIAFPSFEGTFPDTKMLKQDAVSSTATNHGVLNFSLFSRPGALVKSNIQGLEKSGSKDKDSLPSSSHPSESAVVDSICGSRKEISVRCDTIMTASKADAKPLDARGREVPIATELPEAANLEWNSKNDREFCQNFGDSRTKGLNNAERSAEPMVASSVCSGNSVEPASDDPSQSLKRKHRDTEESEGPSEDIEESVGAKKVPPVRGSGSKRSRAAEVHNLSERRRRDRINEKMRALQELIPNCNKVDKASMLDEAIEYLKTLQLQVQIMSMGAGLYMPSIILPPGIPQMHAAHLAHFPLMGIGMNMGMGFGMCALEMDSGPSSMIQMPMMHGAQYPGMPLPGPSAMPGMRGSNSQMFGLPGQAPPPPFPCAPLMPLSGGQLPRASFCCSAAVGPTEPSVACRLKDPIQNTNSQVMALNGSNSSLNHTSIQCQAPEDFFEQPSLVQTQGDGQPLEVTNDRALESGNVNNDLSTGGTGSD